MTRTASATRTWANAMAYPSGNFSSSYSGRLQVTFCGNWLTNSGSDFGSGTLNLTIRGYVGSGADKQTVILDLNHHSGVIERNYVGGSGNVAVGMEYVSHSFSGPSSITANKLTVSCTLLKR